LLTERFKGYDLSGFHEQLNQRGKEVGIVFGDRTLLSNSKLALEASEYARDRGRYDIFHENIFHTYFTEALDIGSYDVIDAVARESGLDDGDMLNALKNGIYAQKVEEARKEGRMINLTGVPTFIINEKYKIVGAQPIEVFRDFFSKIEAQHKS
jgi:predicted DsbA family dithiol-disulfide isomerase